LDVTTVENQKSKKRKTKQKSKKRKTKQKSKNQKKFFLFLISK